MRSGTQNTIIFFSSLLFSFMTIAGFFYDATGQDPTIVSLFKTNTTSAVIIYVMLCIGFFFGFRALFYFIDKYSLSEKPGNFDDGVFSVSLKRWMLVSVIILLVWAPYLFIIYPGSTGGLDYFWQLLQGGGALPLSNHHPVFGSIVFYLLYKTGYLINGAEGGIFFTCLFQMLLMSAVLGYCLAALKAMGLSEKVNVLLIAVFALCPVFPTHAMWAIKDSIFSSIAVILFFGGFLRLWCEKHEVRPPLPGKIPFIVIMAVFFSIYRSGTFYIAVLFMLILIFDSLIYNRKKTTSQRNTLRIIAGMLVLILVVIGWNKVLSYKGVYPTNFRESVGIPSRQIMECYRVRPGKFTASQKSELEYAHRTSIAAGRSIEAIADSNSYRIADQLKPSFFESGSDIKRYIRLWIRIGLKNPEIYADQMLKGSYAYWWPGYDPEEIYIALPVSPADSFFKNYDIQNKKLKYYFESIPKSFENDKALLDQTMEEHLADYPEFYELIHIEYKHKNLTDKLVLIFDKLKKIPVLSVFLTTGLYTWIMLICLIYLITRRKTGVCIWPLLLIIAMACLSPVNGYMRYVLSTDLFSFLMIGMCFLPDIKKDTSDDAAD